MPYSVIEPSSSGAWYTTVSSPILFIDVSGSGVAVMSAIKDSSESGSFIKETPSAIALRRIDANRIECSRIIAALLVICCRSVQYLNTSSSASTEPSSGSQENVSSSFHLTRYSIRSCSLL